MARSKMQRYAELESLPNVLEFPENIKGNWAKTYFKNSNPITLELACGRGEYAIGLAQRNPNQNFIGIDRKGARIWKGAKAGIEQGLHNVAFLRIFIERICDYFARAEVSAIWVTFPDPHNQSTRPRKALTSPLFLEHYRKILKPGGRIHLKTDDAGLFNFTLKEAPNTGFILGDVIENVSAAAGDEPYTAIITNYEQKHRLAGKTIKYLNLIL